MGHGRNRAKLPSLTPEQRAQAALCTRCGRQDSQQHLILECSHPPLTAIRCHARTTQAILALSLSRKYHLRKHQPLRHFIKTFTASCWREDTPDLSRYWLGTWTTDTLTTVLQQPLTAPMTSPQRALFLSTARALTKPLLLAFDELLRVAITDRPLDHSPSAHSPPVHPPSPPSLPSLTHPAAPHCTQSTAPHRTIPSLVSVELAAMHPQNCDTTAIQGPTLHSISSLTDYHDYSTTDAAHLMEIPPEPPP